MSQLVTPFGTFKLTKYETENEFERAVVSKVADIFGERRIYLDCKRRIGAKDGKQSVPDAYLIDVSRPSDPQLYVVENEISSHDLLKHIGVQLLQFLCFIRSDPAILQISTQSSFRRTRMASTKYFFAGGQCGFILPWQIN